MKAKSMCKYKINGNKAVLTWATPETKRISETDKDSVDLFMTSGARCINELKTYVGLYCLHLIL